MLPAKLPSEVLAKRQQYLNSMKAFVEEQEKKLSEVLDTLDMTDEDLTQISIKKPCPFNKDHIIPEASYEKHVNKCRLLNAGYQEDELESLLQNLDFWYKGNNSVLKVDIDEGTMNKILWDHCVQNGQVYTGHKKMPVSHIDANINLTQEDRLAIYRHVVLKSYEAGKVIPVDRTDELLTTNWSSLIKKGLLSEENNKEFSSKLEQLKALRDIKRRRQSYRAKNVHITKKSYTEIIREVIVNQMEVLNPGGATGEEVGEGGESTATKHREEEKRKGGRQDRHDSSDRNYHRDDGRREGSDSRDRRYDRDGDRDRGRYNRDRDRKSDRDRDRHADSDRGASRGDRRGDRDRSRSRDRDRDRDRDRQRERKHKVDRHRDDAPPDKDKTSRENEHVAPPLDVKIKQEVLSEGEIARSRSRSRSPPRPSQFDKDEKKWHKKRRRRSSSSSRSSDSGGSASDDGRDSLRDSSSRSHKKKKSSKHKKKHSKKHKKK